MKVDVSENKSPRLNRCRGILSQRKLLVASRLCKNLKLKSINLELFVHAADNRFPLKTALPPYVASSRSKRSFHLLQFSVFRGIDYLSCSEILHFTQEPLPLSF
ncbi:uncharacterized protein [Montipora capricornis]